MMKKLLAICIALALPVMVSAQMSVVQGGTGRSSFTGGDFIYADSNSFQRLTGTTSPFFSRFSFGLATGTSATTTNFFSTTASSTNLFSQLFSLGNGTTTNATSTNFFSTTASTTNLFGSLINGFGLSACTGTNALIWSGGSFGCVAVPQGTVTSIATNNGLTGGTITTSGTIGLAAIASGNVLANISGASAAPSATATSSLFAGTTGQVGYFSGTGALVGTSTMFISTASRVGIGTTTPDNPLEVLAPSSVNYNGITVSTNVNSAQHFGLILKDDLGNKGTITMKGSSSVLANKLLFGNASSDYMDLDLSTGFLGLSVGTAGSKLDVNGNVAIGYGSSGTAAPTNGLAVSGHTTFEGITSTGATGSGKLVYDGTPTLVTPNIGAATGASLNLGSGAITSGLINSQTISSAANFTGTMDIASNLTVDTSTLFVDATNHRVGIGTTTPTGALDVLGATFPTIQSQRNAGSASTNTFLSYRGLARTTASTASDGFGTGITFGLSLAGTITEMGRVTGLRNGADNSGVLAFSTANAGAVAERARIDNSGTLSVGGNFTVTSAGATSGITTLTSQTHLPTTDNTYDLGSASKRWSELYINPAASGVGDTYICLSTSQQVHQGATCAASTKQIKTNILSISTTTALAQVMALNPVTFTYQPGFYGGKNDQGFIVEDLAAVNPLLAVNAEATSTFQVGSTTQTIAKGAPLAPNQTAILSLLTGAIQNLGSKIKVGATGTTTLDMKKLQINTTNTAGQAVCGLVVGTNLTFSLGACKP